ncbi:MAG TPA: SDR family oxidoreductase [Caulobacteraceae bacterium]|nr:SDR family oxidoreductase [Caulobacteraceae bacterium]
MAKALDGKVALVTGGARGIGAGIVRRLAADGASVALTYAASADRAAALAAEIEAAGGRALALAADAADAEAVRRAVEQTAERFGRLDILVNNAGMGVAATIDQVRLEDFDACVAVNLRAVFVAMQAAAKLMEAGGRIVTIGSVNGDRIPFQGGAIYAATKAAVTGLTRGAARDLGPRGITVNVVQPGPVDTDMNPADGPWADAGRAQTALGRFGDVRDVAALVAFLASDEAAFITGASLNVDGGYNA